MSPATDGQVANETNSLRPGTYRGKAEGLDVEFRLEFDGDRRLAIASGDIASRDDFMASFVCTQPVLEPEARRVTGPVTFRGNPELFTGQMTLDVDERGLGTFQLAVDLEGGHRDIFAGPLEWQGGFLRRLSIEIDGIAGGEPPRGFQMSDGTTMTVQRAFADAGFDVSVRVDPFDARGPDRSEARGWTLAEIHAAMEETRSEAPIDRLHAHVLVCSFLSGRNNRGVLGVMYDFEEADLNRQPREGVAVFYDHPLLSDPRVSEEMRNREYVFTLVHEIGHALNLLHSFDKARPAALSWMNYPHLYPRGYQAGGGYDGTDEFWRAFEHHFDGDELRHLRHASPREIRAGGFSFGVYEEGASIPFGGTVEPRRTRIGANPLRATRELALEVEALKPGYQLGEPVFLKVTAVNRGANPVHVPTALDPSEGYLRITVRKPNGQVIRYKPPVRLCKQAPLLQLPAGEQMPSYDGLPLFLSGDGPLFVEPGLYQVRAELTGVDGSKVVASNVALVRVRSPDTPTEDLAHALWSSPDVMRAMYLRHPLVNLDAWRTFEEEVTKYKPPAKTANSLPSYFQYISALGWLTPFATVRSRSEQGVDLEKAAERFAKVEASGLPKSVERRKTEGVKATKAREKRTVVSLGGLMPTRSIESARTEVSPAGLFGGAGLAQQPPKDTVNPFERIVPTLRGLRRFADIVSWNIEHLHSERNWGKIPGIAELIRSFRCDFWGIQEVDETSLAKLVEALNSVGRIRYEFEVVGGKGQQSGAIFRRDTTGVRRLPTPDDLFDEKIDVKLTDGSEVERPVFHRAPLLCDVRVRQGSDKAFDFRCAVVHLKSTDSKLKDKGNSLRAKAAKALAKWIEHDRATGIERDYIIMGDMNAETARQGLEPFADSQDLALLSVGMQDKYGQAEALTRVASQRLLDHIVVTDGAVTSMPEEDEDEQLIIRIDNSIAQWTSDYSDHVPVAVRFVIGVDED